MATRRETNPASGNKQSDFAGTNTERYGDAKPVNDQDNSVNSQESQNVTDGTERISGKEAEHARNKANQGKRKR